MPRNSSLRYSFYHLGSNWTRTAVLQGTDLLVSLRTFYRTDHNQLNPRSSTNSGLVFFFLVGAIAPLVGYLLQRKWPHSFAKYVNFPVIFNGVSYIPPANSNNYVPWALVGFLFNYVIRRRHFSWWTKYNCTYSVTSGLQRHNLIESILVFFRRCPFRSARFRRSHLDGAHLLHPPVPYERKDWSKHHPNMVGE